MENTSSVIIDQARLGGSKFGKLTAKHYQEIFLGSYRKIEWVCDCGREVTKIIYNVLTGHTKSCGRCDQKFLKDEKFGKLRIKIPQDVMPGSNREIEWVCDCGREVVKKIFNVLIGHTKSCGRCDLMSAEQISSMKFGKLRIKAPQDVMPGSNRKVEWVCDCGRGATISIVSVISGNTKSCGRCNSISAKKVLGMKFGKLRIKDPQNIMSGSAKKVTWVCDCGNETKSGVSKVVSGHTKSCGKCNLIPVEEIVLKKFGKLRIKEPVDVRPHSTKKIAWICDCGEETKISVNDVLMGHTRSCGRCSQAVRNWYLDNEHQIRTVQCPVDLGQSIPGGVQSVGTILNVYKPFDAICPACGSAYKPRMADIKRGVSLTCGCSTNRISFANQELCSFIQGDGLDVVLEYKVGSFKYDLFIPSSNLLIEYHGLKWHSLPDSREQDWRKYVLVKDKFGFMSLFEDEWYEKKEIIKSILKARTSEVLANPIRPGDTEIQLIPMKMADSFYERFHYIGPCRPKVSYGVFLQDRLIACVSFSHPTRQSRHPWELVRMASDPEYRVHGIWSKLLKKFIKEYSPRSVVSFSDNRLFSGAVYGKMGFSLDGEVPPDYYWVKEHHRFHKSALRKTAEERNSGMTEVQLREAQGYRRIWDLGKRRWVLQADGG